MADIARLALQIDSSGARQAKQALDGMRDGSIKAERATDSLASAVKVSGAAAAKKSAEYVKLRRSIDSAYDASKRYESGAAVLKKELDRGAISVSEYQRDLSLLSKVSGAAAAKQSAEYVKLRRSIDSAYDASKRYESGAAVLKKELDRGAISVSEYQRNLSLLSKTTSVSSKASSGMGSSLQQAGYQIGDFAVQVGAGQNVLVAFSQQASQLAGVFGPGGALIGAVIAVGAAIAGPFVRSLDSGKEKLDEIDTSVNRLVDDLEKLTEAQAVSAQIGLTEKRQQLNEKISAELQRQQGIQEQIREEAEKPVDGGLFSDDRDLVAISNWNKELLRSRGIVDTYRSELDGVNQDLSKVTERLREARGLGPSKIVDIAEIREQRNAINDIAKAAEAQADTFGASAREIALYELSTISAARANRAAVDAARDRINAAFDEIEAAEALVEAKEDAAKRERALASLRAELDPSVASKQRYDRQLEQIEEFNVSAAEKEALREQAFAAHQKRLAASAEQGGSLLSNTQQKSLASTGQFFGNLAQLAQEGGRDQFQSYQNLASAQAAISASLAIASTLGDATLPALVRIPLAASIGALAAAQISQIQNQEYRGQRAMGGAVESGGTYLVGDKGPEILTMGQSGHITPNHALGGGDQNVVVNMYEDRSKAGQVEQRQRSDGRMDVDVFVADIRGNGPRAKALQQTYGFKRVGT